MVVEEKTCLEQLIELLIGTTLSILTLITLLIVLL
jgi:hypothetical protein